MRRREFVSKVVEDRTTITCDILFKEIREEDIFREFGMFIVSREAADRLPRAVAENDDFLKTVVQKCGGGHGGFTPELMHRGVWLIRTTWHNNLIHACPDTSFGTYYPELTSVTAAFDVVRRRHVSDCENSTYHVLEDGRLAGRLFGKVEIYMHYEPFRGAVVISDETPLVVEGGKG